MESATNAKSETKKLFAHKEGVSEFSWSPDGKSLVAVAGDETIYVIDAKSGNEKKIASGLAPSWTPDGNNIVFQHQQGLWKVSVMGGEPEPIPLSETMHEKRLPIVSPDGNQLAFELCRVKDNHNFGPRSWFCRATLEGGSIKNLNIQSHGGYHTWSPDSSLLALVAHERLCGNIYIVDNDGKPEEILHPENDNPKELQVVGMRPSFSPDSTRLAFRDQIQTKNPEHEIIIQSFISVLEKGSDGYWRRMETRSEDLHHGQTYNETPPAWLNNNQLLVEAGDAIFMFDILENTTTKLADTPEIVRRGMPTVAFSPVQKSGGFPSIAIETPEETGTSITILTIVS